MIQKIKKKQLGWATPTPNRVQHTLGMWSNQTPSFFFSTIHLLFINNIIDLI